MKVRVLQNLDPRSASGVEWEQLVAANAASGFMQSLPWARFKRALGLRYLHIGLYEDENLLGGAIFYTGADNKGAGLLVAPEGPVLPWHDREKCKHGINLIIQTAEKHAASFGAMAVRVEPRLPPPGSESLACFGLAPVDLIPCETLYLDLNQGQERLLASMKPKCRYNIRLANRHGVKVYEDIRAQALPRFYTLMQEAASRDGFFLEPQVHFAALVETLAQTGMVRLFFAEHEGQLLGTLLLVTYGNRATYLYGGISNQKRNVMAGYALQWQAMQAAMQANCTTYDFYGFDQFMAPHDAYARFSRFKAQFGGQAKRFTGAQDYYFTDRLADALIRALNETSTTTAPTNMAPALPLG